MTPEKTEILDLRPPREFESWAENIYSQTGEDGIIAHILDAAQIVDGFFVEFGAWDGKHLSNCAALADRGFAGCFIEGDAARSEDLQAAYASRSDIMCVNAFVGIEGHSRLDAILRKAGVPTEPTVLSIDVDGMDFHIWDDLTAFHPLLCVVEFNPTISAQVSYVQEANPQVHRGASLAALWKLACRKGYSMVAATELNGIFLRDDIVEATGLMRYKPHEVKSSVYETALFHGYDGHVMTAGHRSLLWHGVTFDDDGLQVLPNNLQKFPIGEPDSYFAALQDLARRK